MKNASRAIRRHHRQRLITKTMKLYILSGVPEPERLSVAKRLYNNRRACSCCMCGHYRKWHGPTIQELRQPLPDDSHLTSFGQ